MMAAVLLALIGIVGLGNAPLGRIASFLARISYSLYLTHWAIGQPLMSFSRRLPTGELQSALYTCGAMVVCLVLRSCLPRFSRSRRCVGQNASAWPLTSSDEIPYTRTL